MERIMVVPLRRAWFCTPRWRRTKKAVSALRQFVARHAKAKEVKIGRWLNEALWARGAKNPPARVRIKVEVKDGIAHAELAELPARAKRLTAKEPKAKEQEKKKAIKETKEKVVKEIKKAKEVKQESEVKKSVMSKKEEIAMHK